LACSAIENMALFSTKTNRGTQDEMQYRVVMGRERWFQVLMGEQCLTDESFTEAAAERVPLPVAATEALAFSLSVPAD
jgi:hypothetical protein